jgi:diacylglycerol kinase (ATP)
MMHVFVVLNPVAGRSQADDVRRALTRVFGEPEWHLEIYETTGEESVKDIVADALDRGACWVLAAGGDGTVSAVTDGLVGRQGLLGIVPTGSGNVIAQELGIPLRLERALQMLVEKPVTRSLDVIEVNDSYFLLAVGTGVDALAIKGTSRQEKRRFGPLAYIWNVLRVILGVQPHRFTLVVDGQKKRVRAADILLSNVGTLTWPLRWSPHIKPDDGQIDIGIMRASSLVDFARIAWDVIIPGRPRQDRNLRFLTARETVEVYSDQPLPVQGDGELLGQTPFDARILPGAVRVLVPNEEQKNKWLNLPLLPN